LHIHLGVFCVVNYQGLAISAASCGLRWLWSSLLHHFDMPSIWEFVKLEKLFV
jgi:hypothetical protein